MEGKEEKKEEVIPEVDPEEAYDQTWDEIEQEEKKPPEGDKTEKKEEEKKDEKVVEEETVVVSKKEFEGVQKALKDTKVFATKLTQEVSTLREAKEKLEKGEGSKGEVDDQIKKTEEAEKALKSQITELKSEYPELEGPLTAIVGKIGEFGKELAEIKTAKAADGEKSVEEKNSDTANQHFQAVIKPEIEKIHDDFDTIVKDPEQKFWNWAATQSQADQFAAFHSSDPKDMVRVLTEYKKELNAGKVQDIKKQQDDQKTENLKNAGSVLGGGGAPGPTKEKPDSKTDVNFDEVWNEAGDYLAKQGIT